MEVFVFSIVVVLIYVVISSRMHAKRIAQRRQQLLEKYGDPEIVDRIMRKMFWQGQTPAQLVDSIGSPVDVDRKIMKTKSKEVWKYHQKGKGRFALRITLEDGYVVGWEQKS